MAKDKSMKAVNKGGPFGGAYFVAVIGAAIYFLETSFGFWGSVLALLKALVWPAFFIHGIFQALGV